MTVLTEGSLSGTDYVRVFDPTWFGTSRPSLITVYNGDTVAANVQLWLSSESYDSSDNLNIVRVQRFKLRLSVSDSLEVTASSLPRLTPGQWLDMNLATAATTTEPTWITDQ